MRRSSILRHAIVASSLLIPVARGQPTHLEAYGDSLTEGLFASTSLETSNLNDVSKALSNFAMFFLSDRQDKTHIKPYLRPDLAWVQEVAARVALENGDPHEVHLINHAVSGAVVGDLVKQVDPGTGSTPVLALFFAGHNDLCEAKGSAPADLAEFRNSYRAALELWDKTHQNSTAVIVPLLPVHRIFEQMHGHVWRQNASGQHTCADLWRYAGYCRRFVALAKQGALRPVLEPIEVAMNQELSVLAIGMSVASSGRNLFQTLDPKIFNVAFDASFFALDCYHPSAKGQKTIGEVVSSAL